MFKRTKEHFEQFKKHCQEWQYKLGLLDWEFFYEFEDIEMDCSAHVSHSYESRKATFCLNKSCEDVHKQLSLEEVAFHELMHLVLCRHNKYVDVELLEESTDHAVIARFINLLFRNKK